jgi:hypothetical protein
MKAIELVVVDSQSDKKIKSTLDAGIIVGVRELIKAGNSITLAMLVTGPEFVVDESYESLRKRWLAARDDQEMIHLEQAKKLSVQ